jgi:FAD/FMN-containing dehydrogenase/Fe-S oxidoreductase
MNMDLKDNAALAARLRQAIASEVHFDAGSRALYSADASNYRQVPIGVVVPRNVDDLVECVRICREFGAPILPRGAGTSMCGQCVNLAVVIDTSKHLNQILNIDLERSAAYVEPGVICDALRDAAERHGLTYAPDPGTHSRCTLGGMIGNNSCGPHSVMSGKTEENIEALEVLTYDGARFWVGPTTESELEGIIAVGGRQGEIYAKLRSLRDRYADEIRAKFPPIRRRVSGYNLNQLLPENGFNLARALVGSEGTCALTLQARTTLVHSPRARVVVVLGYPDIYCAGDAVPRILPFKPIALEGLEIGMISGLKSKGLKRDEINLLPEGEAWLVTEFGDDTRERAVEQAKVFMASLRDDVVSPSAVLFDDPSVQERVWSIRELGASASSLSDVPEELDPAVGWEDAAVDPFRLGDYLREFQKLLDRYGYKTSLYGHFGDGCIHAWITFNLRTSEGLRDWRGFLNEAAKLVVKYGGSITGEHGDGKAKSEFLPIMYGERLMQAFREFKEIWDPQHKLNPRIIVDPYRADENLRKGPDYKPSHPATHFSYLEKHGGFTRAVEHCIGLGKCRARHAGTMCPSYRATGEELHSTRGRSRLLQEMLRGELIKDGWKSEAVKGALDLCLACKGCRSDCPTHVDMATYKAEFLSHYYKHKLRPVQAYTMGMIGTWAGLAGTLPGLTNFFTQTPGLNSLLKAASGIAPERNMPRFARVPFQRQFMRRAARPTEGKGARNTVLLWPDTFNNFFHPETAMAAVEVLEHAGWRVELPSTRLCCGRPLYDFGMLDRAKRQLSDIIALLAPSVEAGIPLVGLEPACIAVFRDELINLFPNDKIARRLARQSFMLSEFLVRQSNYRPPPLKRSALIHVHCHQKSLIGVSDEIRLFELAGLDCDLLDSGCCGMAGSFGFDKEKYSVSQDIGELVLLPEVRAAASDTFIVSNGYSCREQIEQCTDRKTVHSAEVLLMAINLEKNAHSRVHHVEHLVQPAEIS